MSEDKKEIAARSEFGAEEKALIRTFLENNSKELELKEKEIGLEMQRITHGADYSKAALQAQSIDLQDERQFKKGESTKRYAFLAFGIMITAAFGAYAMHLGKDDLVRECLKAILFIGSGAAGGFAWGFVKGKKHVDHEIEQISD